jgi:hypothetical protein
MQDLSFFLILHPINLNVSSCIICRPLQSFPLTTALGFLFRKHPSSITTVQMFGSATSELVVDVLRSVFLVSSEGLK